MEESLEMREQNEETSEPEMRHSVLDRDKLQVSTLKLFDSLVISFNTQEKRKTRTELQRSGKKSFKGSNNFINEDFLAAKNWISVDDTMRLAEVRC